MDFITEEPQCFRHPLTEQVILPSIIALCGDISINYCLVWLQFLELSALSFSKKYGPKMKEGWVFTWTEGFC